MIKLSKIFTICLFSIPLIASATSDDKSTKAERNMICHGNELYNDSNYHAALENYEKSLALNPSSQYALYNKALALLQLASDDNKGTENDPRKVAEELFEQIAQSKTNSQLAEYSYYNLGNMAFNDQQYDKAIEKYKGALRITPENRKARQNLLLAIQKKEEQEKNKEQKQEEQQQEKQKQQKQEQEEQQQEQQVQPQPMSQNSEQILQSVQNKENATRRRNDKRKPTSGQPYTDKPW